MKRETRELDIKKRRVGLKLAGFLPLPGFVELPLAVPSNHITNNCPRQCHALETGIITAPSQETTNRKAMGDKQLPAKY
ncbi:hypothetical protein INR49_023567 [Caranx melampygus]|nr:hypothetical protein INR49_023567 [Caranx melampygus]